MTASIEAHSVTVDYPVFSARGRSLKNRLLRPIGGIIKGHDQSHVVVNALRGVTLKLQEGDRVALLGGNGAGKSTLLRVLAGIMEPTSGRVDINGRVSSLIDMSMGMDAEATGYQNIIMRSVLLGATFAEAKQRIHDIEEFTELGEFLRLPVRTYSSGMSVRLSFGIAMAIEPEILVLDEMIGAGDAAFAEKAKARLEQTIQRLRILVLASHDLNTVRSLCTRGVVLAHGRIVADAGIEDAVAAYQDLVSSAESPAAQQPPSTVLNPELPASEHERQA